MKTPRTTAFFESQHLSVRETDLDRWEKMTEFARELERENTRLREALQPIADLRPTKVGNIPDCEHWLWKPSESGRHDLPGINVAHVKAARAALAVTLSC